MFPRKQNRNDMAQSCTSEAWVIADVLYVCVPHPRLRSGLCSHPSYALHFPSEAQRAPTRECKPTDYDVPGTFLSRLQDLCSCFLKDIAGEEWREEDSDLLSSHKSA